MHPKPTECPHRRYNALTGEWVLVSPHRAERPWLGKQETVPQNARPPYDEKCYLCPGNTRASGQKNSDYHNTYVFTNDYAALIPDMTTAKETSNPLFETEWVTGTCRVICFSPRHDMTLAEMAEKDIRHVIDIWAEQVSELGKNYRWVQIFENKGSIMGCSNPHPHGQIWAGSALPDEPSKEDKNQAEYYKKNRSLLLADYLKHELQLKERVTAENEHWVVLVPFWAIWPFETILLPKRKIRRMPDIKDAERDALADILKKHLTRYDNLFHISFPYTMGWHGAPTDKDDYPYWQLHAHFYPPLLRSATVKKFMVGYEMLSEPQRDITAEQAADHLRQVGDSRYKEESI